MTRLRLEAGSDPADVGIARTFAAAVGRTAGLDDDSLDNLRVAVSEVASAVVELGLGSITIIVDVNDRDLVVTSPLDGGDQRLEGRLALVTRLPFEMSIDRASVRLSMAVTDRES